MASAIHFPDRPLSSRAVFGNSLANGKPAQRPAGDKPGIHALPPRPRSNSAPNVIHFPREMPRDIRQKATDLIKTLADRYVEQSAAYLAKEAERTPNPNAVYRYVNLVTVGPVQFHRPASYWTSSVLTAGEWTAIIALQWNNPATGPAGSLPGNIVVGGKPWRVRFESFNRSLRVPGESKTFNGTFPTTSPQIMVHAWFFLAPDPGSTPASYETNVTFTVGLGPEPLVAFPLRQLDPDGIAPFLDEALLGQTENLERRRRAQEPIRYTVARRPQRPESIESKNILAHRLTLLARQILDD